MNKRLLPIALLTIGFGSEISDYQFWHSEKLTRKLGETSSLSLEQDYRMRDNASELYYFHGDLKYNKTLWEGLDVAISFREIYGNKNDVWSKEHRPNAEVKISYPLGSQTASVRNRLEYRIRGDEGSFRNRTLFTVSKPVSLLGGRSVFLQNEYFYDFEKSEMNAVRLFSGVKLGEYFGAKISVYSMWQWSLSDGDWSIFQVSGLKFGF